MKRRGFLGRVLALPAAVAAAAKAPASLAEWYTEPLANPAHEVFVGGFQIGEITRRSLKFPRRHGKSWSSSLVEARIQESIRAMGEAEDRAFLQGE